MQKLKIYILSVQVSIGIGDPDFNRLINTHIVVFLEYPPVYCHVKGEEGATKISVPREGQLSPYPFIMPQTVTNNEVGRADTSREPSYSSSQSSLAN